MSKCNGHSAHETCSECEVLQLARNHYFTGKLLVERDFNDEQRFFIGKDRRHNQKLHGWGTVCGLKVKQHPNENCQKQYVVVEPGTAIDCCGREIIVGREDYIDFRAIFEDYWRRQHGKDAVPDTQPHTLQICLRYTECPTEDVPALFDECGCDESACMPNRVLESYRLDVLVDPHVKVWEPDNVGLKPSGRVDIPRSAFLAPHEASQRLYVLSGVTPATISVVNTVTLEVQTAKSWPDTTGVGLAVSPDGKRLYAALVSANSQDAKIHVLDTDHLADPAINTLTMTGTSSPEVPLRVTPDGRLFALHGMSNKVHVWATDINSPNSPPDPQQITVGTSPIDMRVAPDGKYIYTANLDSSNVSAINTADLSVTSIPVASAKPQWVAVAASAEGDNLVVVDETNATLHLIAWRPNAVNAADRIKPLGDPLTGFTHRPTRVVASPGGTWAYVLTYDSTTHEGSVQAVDLHRVEMKQPNPLGASQAVGEDAWEILLSSDGRRIYVTDSPDGSLEKRGVSILDVFERACQDIFKRTLDNCPSCLDEDCVVLATVRNYVYQNKVNDAAPQSGQSQIDNLTGRRLLPSTTLLAEAVNCLLEQGGVGAQGPAGTPGAPGQGVTSADAETVNPPATAEAAFDPNTGHIHFKIPRGEKGADGISVKTADAETVDANVPAAATFDANTGHLHFKIPRGEKGANGKDAVALDLPRIISINWPHNGNILMSGQEQTNNRLLKDGLVIAFSKDVLAETLSVNSIELLMRHPVERDTQYELYCYCNVRISVVGVKVAGDCGGIKDVDREDILTGPVNGARIRASRLVPGKNRKPVEQNLDWSQGSYRVLVKGNFILGAEAVMFPDGKSRHPALDADHIGPAIHASSAGSLKDIPARCPSGNMTEGGIFESWFTILGSKS